MSTCPKQANVSIFCNADNYKNLTGVDKADEELIIKDVRIELQNLTILSPGQDKFVYDPEALMVKVTARLFDKYYPLDKPRPEV